MFEIASDASSVGLKNINAASQWSRSNMVAGPFIRGVARRAADLSERWSLMGVLSAGVGICLDNSGISQGSTSTLYLVALFLGSHGQSPRFTSLWTFACSMMVVSSGGTKLSYSIWLSGDKLLALTVVLVVALTLLCQRRRRDQLGRRADIASSERQELADALPHVVWGTSTGGQCEFLNDRYTETFGISRFDAIHEQSWIDPIHPADLDKMQGAWRIAVDTGSAFYSAHARMRMNDGSYRWMEAVGRSVRSPTTGETSKWFGSLIDVQRQVEDRETISRLQFDLQARSDEREKWMGGADERLREIFETRELGWIEYDVRSLGRLAGSLRSLGVTDIRKHLENHPADAEHLKKNVRMLNASQRTWSSLGFGSFSDLKSARKLTRGRHAMDVEASILSALVTDASAVCGLANLSDVGGTSRVFAFTVSISDHGIARAAFLDTSTSGDRSNTAGDARRELARVNRIASASALSASLIHQISQPITAISLDVATATRLIASDVNGVAAVAKVMERLRWNTQRLSDIGTSARDALKSGHQTREPIDIVEVITRTYDLLLDPLDAKRNNLSIVAEEGLPLISVDRVGLQQVIFALLQNSLEARSSTGEPPDISVTITRTKTTELSIVVADRGPGIRREHAGLLFDPFFTTKADHLGFGLTVSQSVVEGFGGSLSLVNRPGGGARAELSVPFREARERETATQ